MSDRATFLLPEVNVALLHVLVVGINHRACFAGSPRFCNHFSLKGHGTTLVSMETSDRPAMLTGESDDSNGALNSSTVR